MSTIKKILDFLTPQHDKLKHFWLGSLITVLCFVLYLFTNYKPIILIPSLIIGFGIEVYQTATKTGKLEFLDLFYTVLPSFFIYFVIWVL